MYISQDPIRFLSDSTIFYQYVSNPNLWVDEFGLYSDLLGSGMGHHLMPRSIANKLNIAELLKNNSIAWYSNIGEDTADLHKLLHRELIDEGIPFHGSKFNGTVDEFFDAAAKAYKDIDVKGYLKIPGTDDKLFRDLTPAEALEKLRDLYKKGIIPCK